MTMRPTQTGSARPPLALAFALAVVTLVAPGCDGGDGQTSAPSARSGGGAGGEIVLLNSSYGPTVELFQDYNKAFAGHWKAKTGQSVRVEMSHGGSGKQARDIVAGKEADVVTLSVSYDVDQIQKAGLIDDGWRAELPNNASPYTSCVVFLVRKGNPKGIKDWPDLAKPGTELLAPNPKTGGGARSIFLAAWAHGLAANGNDQVKAMAFARSVYKNMVALDQDMRGSTTKFVKGTGDALVGWENDILQVLKGPGGEGYELVVPSSSLTIEVAFAVVDKVAQRRGTSEVAREYLKHLYSKEGQEIAAKRYNRPVDTEVAARYAGQFPQVKQVRLEEVFGTWDEVMQKFFNEGGLYDQTMR